MAAAGNGAAAGNNGTLTEREGEPARRLSSGREPDSGVLLAL